MKIKYLIFIFCNITMMTSYGFKKILVFGGKTGWIGKKIVKKINFLGHKAISAKARLENREDVFEEINQIKPDYIINAAAVIGNGADYCEKFPQKTIRGNVIGTLNLIDIAYICGKHLTNLTTGGMYTYDINFFKDLRNGFSEEELPNYFGSLYFMEKSYVEMFLKYYPNVLSFRIAMPITSDFDSKNFIIKLKKYKKVINRLNSWTVLDDFLPIIIDMTLKGKKGPYNLVNPGVMSHNEILDLYKKYIDPNFSYINFAEDEENSLPRKGKPNYKLDSKKILSEYHVDDIHISIVKVFEKMQKKGSICI